MILNPKIVQTVDEETKIDHVGSAHAESPLNMSDISYNLNQGFMGSNKKLDKYNQKEKLEKEEKNMEDSTAKLIAGNDKQEPAKLQDFKIIKVIDKGSFGKVYLVANRHTG